MATRQARQALLAAEAAAIRRRRKAEADAERAIELLQVEGERASKRQRGQVEGKHVEDSTLAVDTGGAKVEGSQLEPDPVKPNETIRALYKRVGWPRSANEKTEGEDLD